MKTYKVKMLAKTVSICETEILVTTDSKKLVKAIAFDLIDSVSPDEWRSISCNKFGEDEPEYKVASVEEIDDKI